MRSLSGCPRPSTLPPSAAGAGIQLCPWRVGSAVAPAAWSTAVLIKWPFQGFLLLLGSSVSRWGLVHGAEWWGARPVVPLPLKPKAGVQPSAALGAPEFAGGSDRAGGWGWQPGCADLTGLHSRARSEPRNQDFWKELTELLAPSPAQHPALASLSRCLRPPTPCHAVEKSPPASPPQVPGELPRELPHRGTGFRAGVSCGGRNQGPSGETKGRYWP